MLFFCQIWYRIWVWAAVHKLKEHQRGCYRICWKKFSCSAPDANRIFKCTLTDMFDCIYPPQKKDSKKNVTSGQSVEQKHHTPYRHSVRTEQRPVRSLQGPVPPRSLTSAAALRLQPCPVSTVWTFSSANTDFWCVSQLLPRCSAHPGGEKWTRAQ